MKKYLFICIGGAAGAVTRYALESASIIAITCRFPINTLIINLSGSFLLTYLMTIFFEAWEIPSDIRIGIGVGFFGAYTTFSTFCKEAVKLFISGDIVLSALYIIISAVFGLFFSFFGILFARKTVKKVIERKQKDFTEEAEID